MVEVSDLKTLIENNKEQAEIIVAEDIVLKEPLVLQPGVTLKGKSQNIELSGDQPLIGLTKNNSIQDLTLRTRRDKEAIFFDEANLAGVFHLKNVRTHGAISFISR